MKAVKLTALINSRDNKAVASTTFLVQCNDCTIIVTLELHVCIYCEDMTAL